MPSRVAPLFLVVLLSAAVAQAQGIIQTVAGGGTVNTFCGDGGRAPASCVFTPMAVSVDRDGRRLWRVRSEYRSRIGGGSADAELLARRPQTAN